MFRRKLLTLLVSLVLLASAFPLSVSANTGAAFTFATVDRTSVNAGQQITFTLRATGANYVFANAGGNFVPAVRQGDNWVIVLTPTQSMSVVVHANTINAQEGAATLTIPVTVQAPAAQQPVTPQQPQQQQGRHRIDSVTEIEATQQNSVTLRITTDSASQVVWISPAPGRYMQATRRDTSGDQTTWEITYRPQQFAPHQIQVSANHAYLLDGNEATQTVSINLAAPFVQPLQPMISRVTASPSTVDRHERTTITVRTNPDVEFVWATINGRRESARRGTTSATARTWTFENVRPDQSQTIRVYANTTDNTAGAATDSVRINVREDENPRIVTTPHADRTVLSLQGWHGWNEATFIEVRTNAAASHVWAITDRGEITAHRHTTASNNEQIWRINVSRHDFTHTGHRSVTIRANTTRTVSGSDSRTINFEIVN